MPTLSTDLVGRVKRLALKPSARSAMMPLFEAISNGLHAIEDKYGSDASIKGRIVVDVHRKANDPAAPVVGFTISDNGIGLDDENYESFLRPDSQHKIKKGGKGVGRLGWLKTFEKINVESCYQSVSGRQTRSFNFILRNEEQVQNCGFSGPTFNDTGVRVRLEQYDPTFENKCPIEPDVIIQRIIGHFLPILASSAAPEIIVADVNGNSNIGEIFLGMIKNPIDEVLSVEISEGSSIQISIRHMLASKAIKSDANRKNYN